MLVVLIPIAWIGIWIITELLVFGLFGASLVTAIAWFSGIGVILLGFTYLFL